MSGTLRFQVDNVHILDVRDLIPQALQVLVSPFFQGAVTADAAADTAVARRSLRDHPHPSPIVPGNQIRCKDLLSNSSNVEDN